MFSVGHRRFGRGTKTKAFSEHNPYKAHLGSSSALSCVDANVEMCDCMCVVLGNETRVVWQMLLTIGTGAFDTYPK